MSSQPPNAVLRRIAGHDPANAKVGTMSPGKALQLALSGASEEVMRVHLGVNGVSESRVAPGDVVEVLPQGALILLLEAESDARGVVAFDAEALAAVIEAATTGRVTGASATERRPTETDALLTRRFLASAFQLMQKHLGEKPPEGWREVWSAGEMVPEARLLPHLLKDVPHRLVELDLVFSGGAAEGHIWLVLPWDSANAGMTLGIADTGTGDWRDMVQGAVLNSEAELEAVLYRFQLPISELTKLKAEDLLTFPADALSSVTVEAQDGRVIAWARLGKAGQARAVRLSEVNAHVDKGAQESQTPQTETPSRVAAAEPSGQGNGKPSKAVSAGGNGPAQVAPDSVAQLPSAQSDATGNATSE